MPTQRPSVVHQPPSPTVVAELVRAGLSASTASAMDPWKALEVLELLRLTRSREEAPERSPGVPRGTI